MYTSMYITPSYTHTTYRCHGLRILGVAPRAKIRVDALGFPTPRVYVSCWVFLSETPGEDIEFGLIRTCIDIHIDVTTYIPNYIHTCIWIDMHIYEHTHTHAHTRTHTPLSPMDSF